MLHITVTINGSVEPYAIDTLPGGGKPGERKIMDRIEYQDRISILIEDACDNLTPQEFKVFKERIRDILENYE